MVLDRSIFVYSNFFTSLKRPTDLFHPHPASLGEVSSKHWDLPASLPSFSRSNPVSTRRRFGSASAFRLLSRLLQNVPSARPQRLLHQMQRSQRTPIFVQGKSAHTHDSCQPYTVAYLLADNTIGATLGGGTVLSQDLICFKQHRVWYFHLGKTQTNSDQSFFLLQYQF